MPADVKGHRRGRLGKTGAKGEQVHRRSGDLVVSEVFAGNRKPAGVVVRLLHRRSPRDRRRDGRYEGLN